MDVLLLGGWRHVVEDVRRLVVALNALPDACTCGNGSTHLAGTCRCCQEGERRLDGGCGDCEALLTSLRREVDELVDASLRFLPFLETATAAGRNAAQRARVIELRRQIQHVSVVLQKVATAADDFRRGCPTSHVSALREIAGELAAATRHLDSLLESEPARNARAPHLV